ncbi:MAG: DNA mismatch repair endonuclease MutL [Gammaproteobacteria bacterium]|nr:DNA mismatch repair endonuclease MutL [Gammaproteobacteria bacterium]
MSSLPSPRIQFLPEQLANQIAAGEVVERPSSVLKELLENAIDAGATHIEVEVEQGGISLIRIRDNGCGIHQEDMTMAVSRHATSKIRQLEELEALHSLGFRGEALASIGSVSRLKLISRTSESEVASMVEAEGRHSVPQQCPVSHPVGTTIEVHDLFFNTPARRKFLRTERTEFVHLEEVFKRAALSRFDIGFTLIHNQRKIFRLRPAMDDDARLKRIADICSRGFADSAHTIRQSLDELSLSGWLGRGEDSRSSSDVQYFFINGRMVRDKLVQHAIRQAYNGVIPEGRYAAYVLYLELPAHMVDVNVHPTKHEVRFQQSRKVHDFLVVAIQRALDSQVALDTDEPVGGISNIAVPRSLNVMENQRNYQPVAGIKRPLQREPVPAAISTDSAGQYGQCLGLIDGRYLLTQQAEETCLIDVQQAEYLLYLEGLQHHIKGTPLLFPAQVSINPAQLRWLEWASEALHTLGFDWDQLTQERIVIRQAPELFHQLDIQLLLHHLMQTVTINGDASSAMSMWQRELACSASIARRYALNTSEQIDLLSRLNQIHGDESFLCKLDASNLAQLFKSKD